MPKPNRKPQIVSILGVLIGCAVFLYPTAADWFSRIGQQDAIAGYAQAADVLPDQRIEAMLQEAREYNQRLPIVDMVDPYGANSDDFKTNRAERDLYESMLNVGQGQPMAWISIASAGIASPIYHGTAESTLKKGAGHLFGSSLPVGGPSTRAIITGHTGNPQAQLFTKVHDLQVGDTFALNTLGEGLYYRVRDVSVIRPEQVEGLGIEPGADLVTLITCTPIGVNSHRLVVTGERIKSPADQEAEEYPIEASDLCVGFPWWVVPLVVLPALAGWLARPTKRAGGAGAGAGAEGGEGADSRPQDR